MVKYPFHNTTVRCLLSCKKPKTTSTLNNLISFLKKLPLIKKLVVFSFKEVKDLSLLSMSVIALIFIFETEHIILVFYLI